VAPRTDPDTITTLTLSLTSPADKRGADACPGLTEVERKQLLERIASGSTTEPDKKLISQGHSAIGAPPPSLALALALTLTLTLALTPTLTPTPTLTLT
jgi:hypothetical protein